MGNVYSQNAVAKYLENSSILKARLKVVFNFLLHLCPSENIWQSDLTVIVYVCNRIQVEGWNTVPRHTILFIPISSLDCTRKGGVQLCPYICIC